MGLIAKHTLAIVVVPVGDAGDAAETISHD
jgi:hypothetical protein